MTARPTSPQAARPGPRRVPLALEEHHHADEHEDEEDAAAEVAQPLGWLDSAATLGGGQLGPQLSRWSRRKASQPW